MKGDLVCLDGRITEFGKAVPDPDALLSANFIYQKIHVLGRTTLHAAWHAEIAEVSYGALYGREAAGSPEALRPGAVSAEVLEQEVRALLDANRYPQASTLVTLYLIPSESGEPQRLLSCERQLLYKGYAMWHTGLRCAVVPYEYPFAPHKTAVSLAAHTYAAGYARRKGFDAAVAENGAGVLTGLGESPLFAGVRNTVVTTPIDDGAADSVERRFGIAVCEDMGLAVAEHPLESAHLGEFEELFAVTPQGIVSVREIGGRLLPHSLAKTIAERMKGYAK